MNSKKFLAGCLCMLIAVGATGCSSQKDETEKTVLSEQTTEEKANQEGPKQSSSKAEISYWVEMDANVVQVAQSYEEIEYYKQLEEKTGVHINFLHPPVGQATEQFKLLVASRKDLPDVIQTRWLTEYPGGPDKAIKDGIIVSLNDQIDKAPNYKQTIERDKELLKQCKTDEGTIYGFHGIQESDLKTTGGLILRKDWLEELGLQIPQTIEEWEIVLRAFKEQKGSEVPLSLHVGDLSSRDLFNTAYDVSMDFYLDDNGKIQYGPIEEGYKEYLITLNKWYKEGLLDPDFASIDGKIIDSNIINGKSGVSFGWIGSKMGTWTNAATEEGYKLVGATNPKTLEGKEARFAPHFTHKIGGSTAAITTNSKNVDTIIDMFDYMYTEEGLYLKNFGVEGLTYNMVDGKPVYTDLILNNPDGLSIGQAMGKYFQANYPAVGMSEVPEYTEQYYQLEEQKEARQIFNQNVEVVAQHVIPPTTPTSDESKEIATIMTDVNTYKDEMFIAFVTGAKSLDEFDSYVEQMRQLGIERAIELKQAGIDRYNAR